MPAIRCSRLRWVPLGAAVLWLAGCGLSDYEDKLDAEQKRLQNVDHYLGSPVEVPRSLEGEKAEDYPLVPVFFRPPKGIARTCEKRRPGQLLLTYPGTGSGNFKAVYLAATADIEWEQFKEIILQSFAVGETGSFERVKKRSFTGKRLEFETPSPEAGIYFLRDGNYRVAIIFQPEAEEGKQGDIRNAIDYSLRSLAVGTDAARMLRYPPPEPPAKPKK